MKKILFLLIILLIPISLSGFPSVDDETSFIDSMRQTSENDIQNPRASGRSFRKASEDKHPWEGSFPEMELIAWPSLDGSPRPIDIPKVIIPDADPKTSNRPDYKIGDRGGCFLVGPAVWNFFGPDGLNPIQEPYRTWVWDMTSNGMIITDISLSGPAKITQVGGSGIWIPIWVKAYQNITKKVPVKLTARGTSYYDIGNGPVSYEIACNSETIIYPTEIECECIGTTPTIVDSDADDAIPSAGTVNVWVDSGGLACPPYTWTVSGTGWSIKDTDEADAITDNDLETATLSLINTTGKTCGTHYDPYATVTVTDNCGVTDDIIFRYSNCVWSVGYTTICGSSGGYDAQIYGTPVGNKKYSIWCNTTCTVASAKACSDTCGAQVLADIAAGVNGFPNASTQTIYCVGDASHPEDCAVKGNVKLGVKYGTGGSLDQYIKTGSGTIFYYAYQTCNCP